MSILVLGHSHQLSLNKIFDPSTPSMRKVDDGGEKKGGEPEKIGGPHFDRYSTSLLARLTTEMFERLWVEGGRDKISFAQIFRV